MADDLSFAVHADGQSGDHLVAGFAGPGVAGLTGVDYLVDTLDTTQVGHVATRNLPDLTPFSEGRPRRPVRLYDVAGSPVTLLESEVFLPVGAADAFAGALAEWADGAGLSAVTVLHGGTFPHSEEQHDVFHVATDAYRERHVPDTVPALAGGYFDGVVAELLTGALDGTVPPTGVLATPAHPPGPDLDAALRLLDGLHAVADIEVDQTGLRQQSEEVRRYYGDLAQRMESLREGDASYPEDRMYM